MRNNKPARCLGYCYLAKSWTFTGPCFRAYLQGLAAVKAALRPPIHHRTFSFPSHGAFMRNKSQWPTQGYAWTLTENKGQGEDKKDVQVRVCLRGRNIIPTRCVHHPSSTCVCSMSPENVYYNCVHLPTMPLCTVRRG